MEEKTMSTSKKIIIVLLVLFILLSIWLLPKIWRGIKKVFGFIRRTLGGNTADEPPASALADNTASKQQATESRHEN